MFHTATAVLLSLNIQRSSHHALIAAFGEYVAKPALMEKKFHRNLLDAFTMRSESDYLPVPETDEEKAIIILEQAKELLGAAKDYLQTAHSGAAP